MKSKTTANAITATPAVSLRSTPAPRGRVSRRCDCTHDRQSDTPSPESALPGRW
jgi:hypothetical protein